MYRYTHISICVYIYMYQHHLSYHPLWMEKSSTHTPSSTLIWHSKCFSALLGNGYKGLGSSLPRG